MRLKQSITQKHKNSCIPLQASQVILKQIIQQSGLSDPIEQSNIKNRFDKKYLQHLNLLQYNRIRQDKFIESQKKVLEKYNNSIQYARDHMQNKQLRALENKNKSINERNKRIQVNLERWRQKLQMTKEKVESHLDQSSVLIQGWKQKLSKSHSRKSLILDNISVNLKQKWEQKSKKVEKYQRHQRQLRSDLIKNPQQNLQDSNIKLNRSKVSKRSIRVSTENIQEMNKRYQDDRTQRSLLKMISKESKINEARYLKKYLLKKKQDSLLKKEESISYLRMNNLEKINSTREQKNKELDNKFYHSKIKIRNKSSLPAIQIKSDRKSIMNGPGEQWRNKKGRTVQFQNDDSQYRIIQSQRKGSKMEIQPNKGSKDFDRIINDKLRNFSQFIKQRSVLP